MGNVGIAFIYCEWSLQKYQTALNLIANIARQFAERLLHSSVWPQTRVDIETFRKEKPSPKVDDYLTFLNRRIMDKFDRSLIVVDGLDELDAVSHRDEFVKALLRLSNAQLLVTSRSHLPPISGSTILDIISDPRDINIYVQSRIQRSTPLRNSIEKQPSLEATILGVIEKTYSNMYVLPLTVKYRCFTKNLSTARAIISPSLLLMDKNAFGAA
jgi:hypothetical protein